MYPLRANVRPEFPAELEVEVMARYETLYTRRKWSALLNPRNRIGRYAMGSLLIVALIAGACELPTSTSVEMGHHVNVRFVPADNAQANGTLEAQLQTALAAAGAEKIGIRLQETDDGRAEMNVLVWGQHISQGDVERLIEQRLGEERILTVNIQALTGNVSETLGKRIGRRVFDIDVGSETVEELRATIVARLVEQGFDGNTKVDVKDDGSIRKVTIEAGTADGSREIADEVIIERRDN
jgi:hypothetical protein